MSSLPQLFMRLTDYAALPELEAALARLPDGVTLTTHKVGEETEWEALIEASFGQPYSFERIMRAYPDYAPERIFYLVKDGRRLATASAFGNAKFPGEGWLHMVGVSPDAQGLGLAKPVVLAALHNFRARGVPSVMLSTDDFRLPAIKTYLGLGFVPLMNHESHPARWQAVTDALAAYARK